ARLRRARGEAPAPDRARYARKRPAGRTLRRRGGRGLHREHGGGARRGRPGPPAVGADRPRVLRAVPPQTGGRRADGRPREAARRADRGDLREVRPQHGHQAGALRPLPGLPRLPRVPQREVAAGEDRRGLSGLRRRPRGEAHEVEAHLLRLRHLPGLRVDLLAEAGGRALPDLRRHPGRGRARPPTLPDLQPSARAAGERGARAAERRRGRQPQRHGGEGGRGARDRGAADDRQSPESQRPRERHDERRTGQDWRVPHDAWARDRRHEGKAPRPRHHADRGRARREAMSLHIDQADIRRRVDALRALLAQHELDALLVSQPESRYYLSGYAGTDLPPRDSAGYLLVTRDKQQLLTDMRTTQQAEQEAPSYEVVQY